MTRWTRYHILRAQCPELEAHEIRWHQRMATRLQAGDLDEPEEEPPDVDLAHRKISSP